MNKKAELKRLHSIVFEGAPDNCVAACMTNYGTWFYICYEFEKISLRIMGFKLKNKFQECKNQPETDLDWTETLISRY